MTTASRTKAPIRTTLAAVAFIVAAGLSILRPAAARPPAFGVRASPTHDPLDVLPIPGYSGAYAPNGDPLTLLPRLRSPDVYRCMLIMVKFTPSDLVSPAHDKAYYELMMFGSGNRSLDDYYHEVSYGRVRVTGFVAGSGWYQVSRSHAYYGGEDDGDISHGDTDSIYDTDGDGVIRDDAGGNYKGQPGSFVRALAAEAMRLADADVDYSQFDDNHDGYVSPSELHIMVVHSGLDQADPGSPPETIWSHRYHIGTWEEHDGVKVGYYTMMGETNGVGIFAHEIGHDLGWPDLYDYDEGSAEEWNDNNRPMWEWCLMAKGSEGGPGNNHTVPAHPCGWAKMQRGWIQPTELTHSATDVPIRAIETNNGPQSLYKVHLVWHANAEEYLLIENRFQGSSALFDKFEQNPHTNRTEKDSGLIITHVDESQPDGGGRWNDGPPRNSNYGIWLLDPGMTPEQGAEYQRVAGPEFQWGGDAAYALEDTGQTEVSDNNPYYKYNHLYPSTRTNAGTPTGITIRVTSRSGEVMTFDIEFAPQQVFAHSFGPGTHFLSIPCRPVGTDTVQLFGTDQVAVWDPRRNPPGYVLAEAQPDASVLQAAAGRAYWVRFSESNNLEIPGRPAGETNVSLYAGWNQLGIPFTKALPFSCVTTNPSGALEPFAWAWNASEGYQLVCALPVLNALADLEPWRGYWVHSTSDCIVTLPQPDTATARAHYIAGRGDWAVRLMARCGKLVDRDNFFGVSREAAKRGAPLRFLSPPARGRSVDISFTDSLGRRYATDLRPDASAGEIWRFVVATDMPNRPVTLLWPSLADMPKWAAPVLTDLASGDSVYMRTQPDYSFQPNGTTPRPFEIRLERASSALALLTAAAVVPTGDGAVIRYTLGGRGANVEVDILNIAGRLIRKLAGRIQSRGTQQAQWDGRSADGSLVPNGTYLFRLRARAADGSQVVRVLTATILR